MSIGTESQTGPPPVDWIPVLKRALEGDRGAYARLVRLVNGYLARWRAYDFRPDWDDIVQEVLISTLKAYQEGRIDAPGALEAYARQATRFKFIDRIRLGQRRPEAGDPEDFERAEGAESTASSTWPPGTSGSAGRLSQEMRVTLARELERLPARERAAVYEVHVLGRTYEEAAEKTGIPLGSLKRELRTGLASLREALGGSY